MTKTRFDELIDAVNAIDHAESGLTAVWANMMADMGEQPELLRRVLESFNNEPKPNTIEIYKRFKEMENESN